MNTENPLIRFPTQSARLNLFDVLAFAGLFAGALFGLKFGHRWFGIIGAIAGAVVGGLAGLVTGHLPNYLSLQHTFKDMQKRSNAELRDLIEKGEGSKHEWKFFQTLALLNLQARGEDVQSYLPRILTMLESEDWRTRLFGRDALRLVFTELAVKIDDYNPRAATDECRRKVAVLRANE